MEIYLYVLDKDLLLARNMEFCLKRWKFIKAPTHRFSNILFTIEQNKIKIVPLPRTHMENVR